MDTERQKAVEFFELLFDVLAIGALSGSLIVFCKKQLNTAQSCCTVPWIIVKAILAIEGIVCGCSLVQDWDNKLAAFISGTFSIVIIIFCSYNYDWSSWYFDLGTSLGQIMICSIIQITKLQYLKSDVEVFQLCFFVFGVVSYLLNWRHFENSTLCDEC